MTWADWIKTIFTVLGGGLAGALLTTFVTEYRAQLQPVGERIETAPLFAPSVTGTTLRTTVTVFDGKESYQFNNLHVADVLVVNQGNRDMTSFPFGLTLSGGDTAVRVEPDTPDRHHTITPDMEITPQNPVGALDFVLKPFNRDDIYRLKVFIIAGKDKPSPIKISSPEPVRFISVPALVERPWYVNTWLGVGIFVLDIGFVIMSIRYLRRRRPLNF